MKHYYEAIRALPPEWVDDETKVIQYGQGLFVAANPKFTPMIYRVGWKWAELDFKSAPAPEHRQERILIKAGKEPKGW